jgi:C_GCAxxG_C_C family probable redox protein
MTKQQKAIEYHRNKFNCSQAVFAVMGTDFGLSEDDCLKVACAFGGGMGRLQYTCGAVAGALMALGLKYGMALNDPEEKKLLTYAKTKEFFSEFEKLHGSINCKELLNGLNMNDPADFKKIKDQNLFEIRCEQYIVDAINIVEKL